MVKHNLIVKGIRKQFPGVIALDGANFDVRPGEVHALIGANGAGKSTLIKVIAGLERPDAGTIFVKGIEVDISEPGAAAAAGLSFIHQDLALVDRLTVAENLQIGNMPSVLGIVNKRELDMRCREVLASCLPGVSSRASLGSLSIAQKWMLSIARMILADSHTIFLDEPTAALGSGEVEILFESIRRVVQRNCSVVFVSHRLEEVLQISHRVSVMTAGQVVATIDTSLTHKTELVQLLTGNQKFETSVDSRKRPTVLGQDVLLELDGVSNRALSNVSMSLMSGEVVGVAGLLGSGRSELLETIFGFRRVESGVIKVKGESVKLRSPVDAVKQKIAFLPEDRKSMALFLNRSVVVNTSIVFLTKFIGRFFGLMNFASEEKAVISVTNSLKLKSTGPSQLLRQLSGGNQQKVVVARWLCGEPLVILADEPTTGVDVGAKIEMLSEFREIAKRGSAVMIVSSDFSELVSSCDRILVMKSGRIINEFSAPFLEQSVLAACFGNAA